MHSMEVDEYTVNYNSDFSGEVHLVDHSKETDYVIPFEVFEALVADKVRVEMIIKSDIAQLVERLACI